MEVYNRYDGNREDPTTYELGLLNRIKELEAEIARLIKGDPNE